MSDIINQNTEPLFIFDMPDDETLSETISVKGEKGERGDPTKLSQLENDEGFITKSVSDLTNYYSKTATDDLLDAKLDKTTFDAYEIPSDFYTSGETISGTGTSVALANTSATILKSIAFYGDISQDGAPTPSAPVDVDTVTGEQSIAITGDDTQVYVINLSNIELCKIGDHQDSIYKHDGKWYKKSEVGKYTVTGNESFVWDATIPRLYLAQAALTDLGINCVFPTSASVVADALTNKFTVKTFTQVYTNKQGGFAMSPTGHNWQFSALDWSEREDAIEDITGTVVYYALAEAVEDEITDPTLILQLETIERAKSYNGTTIITATGTLPAVLYVEGFKNGWSGTIDGINADLDTKADKNGLRHRPYCYNTLAEMIKDNLMDGDLAITSGYYAAGDGGGAKYTITNAQLTADDAFIIELANGLYAKLVIENNQVNIRQLGARSQDTSNNKYDIAPYIAKYLATVGTSNTTAAQPDKITLYIPSGVWHSSPLDITGIGYSIIGDEQFISLRNRGTIISSLVDNQNYIFNFNSSTNFTLKNICFSTADFSYNQNKNIFETNASSIKSIGAYCVKFSLMSFGDTDNLYFEHINGQALEMASSWEIRHRKLFFRDIDAHSGCIVKFAKYVEGASGAGGVNASSFDNMMFEHVLGHLIYLESNCKLANCHFGVINFEDNEITRSYVTYTEFTSENIATFDASNPVHYAVFCIGEAGTSFNTCIIGSIQLNNISTFYSTINGQNYCYDNIFRVIGAGSVFNIVVNNIDSLGIKKQATILYSHDAVAWESSFILNNLSSVYANSKRFVYDVDKFTYIRHDGRRLSSVSAVVPRLTCSATPAHLNVANRGDNRGNLLKSDVGAQNELGVCVDLSTYYTAFTFLKSSEKLYIRAKIPNGQTAVLYLASGTNQTENLAGTGSFAVYEITLSSSNSIGDAINVALANSNTADYCLVDYFIN